MSTIKMTLDSWIYIHRTSNKTMDRNSIEESQLINSMNKR